MFMPGLRGDALGASVHDDFAGAVRQLGHTFRIVTTASGAARANWTSVGSSPAWRAVDRALSPWSRTRALLSSAAALSEHLDRDGDRIDVLHEEVAYPFAASAALAVGARRWRGLLAVTPMGEDTLVHEPSSYGFRRHVVPRWLVARTLRGAGGIRCISPLHERVIASIAPDVPRRVIPLNVNASIVAMSSENADARAARRADARATLDGLFHTAGRPIVLSLGRLHPFKGIDVLVRAMRHIPDATLVIAGPSLRLKTTGDEAGRLAGLVDRYELRDRVRLVGPVRPEMAPIFLAAADVLAVPSHLESLNKVCVEAAAVGTPFVVTDSTGISAWVGALPVGSVVPSGDDRALAEGIRATLGRAAPAMSDTRAFVAPFTPERVARQVCAFYEELLAGR